MKIVFDKKTQFAVSDIPNSEIYGGLIDFARAQGVPVYKTMKPETYETFPTLFWYAENGFIDGSFLEAGHPRFTWITIDQFIQACKEYKDNQPITMKIGTYTAEVLNGFVKVGCQNIPFEQVKELYALILKAEAKN